MKVWLAKNTYIDFEEEEFISYSLYVSWNEELTTEEEILENEEYIEISLEEEEAIKLIQSGIEVVEI